MCRLLAISSRRAPAAAVLHAFQSLAYQGRTPTPGHGPDLRGHNDGWGMAGFLGGRLIHEKSAFSATDPQGGWDDAIRRLLAPSLWPGQAIFHLRRASAGMDVKVANAHPFHRKLGGQDWFFMGNGTVHGYDPASHGGLIDTEYFMGLVLERLSPGGELKEAIDGAKAELATRYPKYDSLVGVFLHSRGMDAYYDVADKFDRYHTLCRADADGSTFICSEEMAVEGLAWTPLREIGGLTRLPGFPVG